VSGNAPGSGGNSIVSMQACHTGIETRASTVRIKGCNIYDVTNGIIASGGTMQGAEVTYNKISAVSRGIQTYFQAAVGGPKVEWNDVKMRGDNNAVGIDIGGSDFFPQSNGLVQQNTVTMESGYSAIRLGVAQGLKAHYNTLNLPSPAFGIRAEGGDKNTLLCNNISGTSAGSTGIYSLHASRGQVSCNTANGPTTGLRFEGVQVGKLKADVAGNTLQNNGTGLLLGTDAIIGEQNHRGNLWKGAFTQAKHLSPDVAPISLFTVDASEDADFAPDQADPQNWFFAESTEAATFKCGNSCNVAQLTALLALDKRIARGELPASTYAATVNWLAQRRLSERISEEGNPYPNDVDLNNFITNSQSNGLAAYAALQTAQRGLFNPGSSDVNNLTAQEQGIFDLMTTLANLEQQLHTAGISSQDSANLATQINSTRTQLEQNTATYINSLNTMQSTRSSSANSLSSQNSLLGGSATYQQYERTINAIWLQTIAQGSLNFSSTQVSDLTAIANGCPLSDGEAVLRARAMLQSVSASPMVFDDAALCSPNRPGERNLVQKSSGETSVQILPNPANDQFTVVYVLDEQSADQTLRIFNTMGQQVLDVHLNSGNGSQNISTTQLPSGTYYYQLQTAKGKIVIQH
jgi:hypothetical protein